MRGEGEGGRGNRVQHRPAVSPCFRRGNETKRIDPRRGFLPSSFDKLRMSGQLRRGKFCRGVAWVRGSLLSFDRLRMSGGRAPSPQPSPRTGEGEEGLWLGARFLDSASLRSE